MAKLMQSMSARIEKSESPAESKSTKHDIFVSVEINSGGDDTSYAPIASIAHGSFKKNIF